MLKLRILRSEIKHQPRELCSYLCQFCRETLAHKEVTVAITPNGYADGLAKHDGEDFFVLPLEVPMAMGEFLDTLDRKEYAWNNIFLFLEAFI